MIAALRIIPQFLIPHCAGTVAGHSQPLLQHSAVGGAVPAEPTFRQRLGYLAILPGARDWVDDALATGFDLGGAKRPERIRLRTVVLNLMYVAAIDGSHGGRKYLRLGRNCHQAKTFQAVFRRLAA